MLMHLFISGSFCLHKGVVLLDTSRQAACGDQKQSGGLPVEDNILVVDMRLGLWVAFYGSRA